MYPPVTGFFCEPSMLMTFPRWTVTARLQASGQSRGQAVSTTVAGPPRTGSAIHRTIAFLCVRWFDKLTTSWFDKLTGWFDKLATGAACRHHWWRIRRSLRGARVRRRGCSRHVARSSQLPPVSAAVVSGGDGVAVARRHRVADPLGAAHAEERPGAARRRPRDRCRESTGDRRFRSIRRAARADRLRLSHRRRWRRALLLRARRVGGARAGTQDA